MPRAASQVTTFRLHPLIRDHVLEQADHDMRRVEVVSHQDGLITEAKVHNRPVR